MEKPRIVVAEDDDNMARMLQYRLEKAGFDVTIASDGNDAVRVIRQIHPSVSLLDLGLPELNGMEILRQLRADEGTEDLRVIVLSGRDDHRDIRAAVEAGANDYLCKPINPEELLACVERHIALR